MVILKCGIWITVIQSNVPFKNWHKSKMDRVILTWDFQIGVNLIQIKTFLNWAQVPHGRRASCMNPLIGLVLVLNLPSSSPADDIPELLSSSSLFSMLLPLILAYIGPVAASVPKVRPPRPLGPTSTTGSHRTVLRVCLPSSFCDNRQERYNKFGCN